MELSNDRGSWRVPVSAKLAELAVTAPRAVPMGLCPINEVTHESITLTNVGQVPASFHWQVAEPWSITPMEGTIAAGGKCDVSIACLPMHAAAFEGEAVAVVNGGKARVSVQLSAAGKYQFVRLDCEELDFGEVLITPDRQAVCKTVRLQNPGGVPATVTVERVEKDRPGYVTVAPKQPVVLPGSAVELAVRYTPRVDGLFTAETFAFSTPGGNTATLTVKAMARGPRVTLERKDPPAEASKLAAAAAMAASSVLSAEDSARMPTGLHSTQAAAASADAALPPPAGVQLSLRCSAAGGAARPCMFNFSDVQVGHTANHVLTLRNHSSVPAAYSFDSAGTGAFSVSAPSGIIPAKLYTHITLTFAPHAPVNYYRRFIVRVADGGPCFADCIGSGYNGEIRPQPLHPRHVDAWRLRTPAAKLLSPDEALAVARVLTAHARRTRRQPVHDLSADGGARIMGAGQPAGTAQFVRIDEEFDDMFGSQTVSSKALRKPRPSHAEPPPGVELWDVPLTELEGDEAAHEALTSAYDRSTSASGVPAVADSIVAGMGARLVAQGSRPPAGLVSRATRLWEREMTLTGLSDAEISRSGHTSRAAAALMEEWFHATGGATPLPGAAMLSPPYELLDSAAQFSQANVGSSMSRVVRLRNNSRSKAMVAWSVPRQGHEARAWRVVPEQADVEPNEIVQFTVQFTPQAPGVYYSSTLEAYVAPKSQRSFRLVDEEVLAPPACLLLDASGHTFGASEQFLPRVRTSCGNVPLHLPPVCVGDAAHATFTLYNDGDTPASFSMHVAPEEGLGADSADAQWEVKPKSGAVAPGSFVLVTARFKPAASGVTNAILSCDVSGGTGNPPPILIRLRGTADVPSLELPRGGAVFVKPTCVGVASVSTFELRNSSSVPLRYRLRVPRKAQHLLSVQPAEGELRANERTQITAKFAPADRGRVQIKLGVDVYHASRFGTDWAAPSAAIDALPRGTGFPRFIVEGGHISKGMVVTAQDVSPAQLPAEATGGHDVADVTAGLQPVSRRSLTLVSEGSVGVLAFEPAGLNFGTVLVGAGEHKSLRLRNNSDCTVYFSIAALIDEKLNELDAENAATHKHRHRRSRRSGARHAAGGGAQSGGDTESEADEGRAPRGSVRSGDGQTVFDADAAAAATGDMGISGRSAGDAMLAAEKLPDVISFEPASGVLPAHADTRLDIKFTPPRAATYVFRVYYKIHSDQGALAGDSPAILPAGAAVEAAANSSPAAAVDTLETPASSRGAQTGLAPAAPPARGSHLNTSINASAAAAVAASQAADAAAMQDAGRSRSSSNASSSSSDTDADSMSLASSISSGSAFLQAVPGEVPLNDDSLWCEIRGVGGYPSVTFEEARAVTSREALLSLFPSPPAPVPGSQATAQGSPGISIPIPPQLASLLANSAANKHFHRYAEAAAGVSSHCRSLLPAAGVELDLHVGVTADGIAFASTPGLGVQPVDPITREGLSGLAQGDVNGIPLGGDPSGAWAFFCHGDLMDTGDANTGALPHPDRSGPQPSYLAPAQLWRQLSLSDLNRHLARRLTQGELAFNSATRNETAEHALKSFVFEFAPAPLGTVPMVIQLSVRNNSALPVAADFRFVHDPEFEKEAWADENAPRNAAAVDALAVRGASELTGRRIFDVQPRSCTLHPGQATTLTAHYAYASAANGGQHEVAGLLRLANGKQVRIVLRGRTLNPAFPFLYAGLPQGTWRLKSTPLGVLQPAAQPLLLHNTSAVDLAMAIDTRPLVDAARAAWDYPVLTAVACSLDALSAQQLGEDDGVADGSPPRAALLPQNPALHLVRVPAGHSATVWLHFSPLEAREYSVPMRIAYTYAMVQDDAAARSIARDVALALDSGTDLDAALLAGPGPVGSVDSITPGSAVLQRQRHVLAHALAADPTGELGLNPMPNGRVPDHWKDDQVLRTVAERLGSDGIIAPLAANTGNGHSLTVQVRGRGYVPGGAGAAREAAGTDDMVFEVIDAVPAVTKLSVPLGAKHGEAAEALQRAQVHVSGMEGCEGAPAALARTAARPGPPSATASLLRTHLASLLGAGPSAMGTAVSTAHALGALSVLRARVTSTGRLGALAPPRALAVRYVPRPGEEPAVYHGSQPAARQHCMPPVPWAPEGYLQFSQEQLKFGDVPAGAQVHRILVLHNCRDQDAIRLATEVERAARAAALGAEAAKAAGTGAAAAVAKSAMALSGNAAPRSVHQAKGRTDIMAHAAVAAATTVAGLAQALANAGGADAAVVQRVVGDGSGPVRFLWDPAHPGIASGALRVHPRRGQLMPGEAAVVRVTLRAPSRPQYIDTDLALLVGVTAREMKAQLEVMKRLTMRRARAANSASGPPDPVHVPVALKSTLTRDRRIELEERERVVRGESKAAAADMEASHTLASPPSRFSIRRSSTAASSTGIVGSMAPHLALASGVSFAPAGNAQVLGAGSLGTLLRGSGLAVLNGLAIRRMRAALEAEDASIVAAPGQQRRSRGALGMLGDMGGSGLYDPQSSNWGAATGSHSKYDDSVVELPLLVPTARVFVHVLASVRSREDFEAAHGDRAYRAFHFPSTPVDLPLLPASPHGVGRADSDASPRPSRSSARPSEAQDVLTDVLAHIVADAVQDGTVGTAYASLPAAQPVDLAALYSQRRASSSAGDRDCAQAWPPAAEQLSAAGPYTRAWVLQHAEVRDLVTRTVESTVLSVIRDAVSGGANLAAPPVSYVRVASRQ